MPGLTDITAVDDGGVTYTLRCAGMSSYSDHPDSEAWPRSLKVRLDPIPPRGARWIEFRGHDGSAARLLPAARRPARAGPWSLDLGVTLPAVEDVTLTLDTLASAADSWRLYLRAAPGWQNGGAAGNPATTKSRCFASGPGSTRSPGPWT